MIIRLCYARNMKQLFLFSLLIVAACETRVFNTGQDLTVNLAGTEAAHCTLSTNDNRYSLDAPGTVFIERDAEELKIDCDDNYSGRRRVIKLNSEFRTGYWNYPEEVTVDFRTLDNGNRYNGYRADLQREPVPVLMQKDDDMPVIITEILTEDSYSAPLITSQEYPVEKDYYMGRKSYPVSPQ